MVYGFRLRGSSHLGKALGEAHVDELEVPVVAQQQVLGFKVAEDDAVLVQVADGQRARVQDALKRAVDVQRRAKCVGRPPRRRRRPPAAPWRVGLTEFGLPRRRGRRARRRGTASSRCSGCRARARAASPLSRWRLAAAARRRRRRGVGCGRCGAAFLDFSRWLAVAARRLI